MVERRSSPLALPVDSQLAHDDWYVSELKKIEMDLPREEITLNEKRTCACEVEYGKPGKNYDSVRAGPASHDSTVNRLVIAVFTLGRKRHKIPYSEAVSSARLSV